jgi:hypothetical protein
MRLDGTKVKADVLEARIPVDVESDTADGLGPAAALRALSSDPRYLDSLAERGGLLAVTTWWEKGLWIVRVQYQNRANWRWQVDADGNVEGEEL